VVQFAKSPITKVTKVHQGNTFGPKAFVILRALCGSGKPWAEILAPSSSIPYHLFLSRSRPSALRSIFRQLCPRCQSARIFRSSIYWGFPKMHDCCPTCDLRFNRETGYFLGAMYISYGLALALIVILGAILWALTGWTFGKITIWAILLFLPFAPMLTFFSRVLWIYLDQAIDPEPPKRSSH
jgi:uncharacterized protein (DUF983 family)